MLRYLSDATVEDYPLGGAEQVDSIIASHLNTVVERISLVKNISISDLYIISNFVSIPAHIKNQLVAYRNYIIFEHDYKFMPSRNPWHFKDSIVPEEQKIFTDFYNNARTIIVQGDDHHQCFTDNGFRNLTKLCGGIWNTSDIQLIDSIATRQQKQSNKLAIYNSRNPGKNVDQTIEIAQKNNWDYQLIDPKKDRDLFLRELSMFSGLLYYPQVRESFCRIAIEARCFSMNVFMFRLCGAMTEDWTKLSGRSMIDFIAESSERNLKTISGLL